MRYGALSIYLGTLLLSLFPCWIFFAPSVHNVYETDLKPFVRALENIKKPTIDPEGVAVIIENRSSYRLFLVLNNFLQHLPSGWVIYFLHASQNSEWLHSTFAEEIKNEKIIPVYIPFEDVSRSLYSRFLTMKEFYEAFPSEKMLIFQKDTVICSRSNSPFGLEEAFEYPYVGAPWKVNDTLFVSKYGYQNNNVGNGGLSFRNSTFFRDLLEHHPINNLFGVAEDAVLITSFVQYRPLRKKVSFDDAKKFSVEMIYYEQPWGVHNPRTYAFSLKERLDLVHYCPEISTILGRWIIDPLVPSFL